MLFNSLPNVCCAFIPSPHGLASGAVDGSPSNHFAIATSGGNLFALCGPGFCGCGSVKVSAEGWADFTSLMADQDNGKLRRSAVAGSGGARFYLRVS